MQDLGRAARGAAAAARSRHSACSTPARRPGGKTTHLAELADVELVALDSDEARLARVRENLARLQPRRTARARASRAMPATPRHGGTAARSTASSPTCRARRRASCAATPTASGCAARPTSRASRGSRRACSTRCGPASRADGLLLYATCSVFARGKRGAGRGVPRPPRRCVARIPHLCRRRSPIAAGNSCLRSRARATIRTGFSTRCSASPDGGSRGARLRPPRRRRSLGSRARRPARRHAPRDPIRRRVARLRRPPRRSRRSPPASLLVAGAALRSRAGARRHDRRQVGRAARRRGRVRPQRRVRPRAQPDARGGAAEGRAALLRARVRARAPALVLARREGAVVRDAVPRLVQRADAPVPRVERPARPDRSTRWTRSSGSCRG